MREPRVQAGSTGAYLSSDVVIALLATLWVATRLLQRQSIARFTGASTLEADFGITAGLLVSIHFSFHGLMQIPSGIRADQVRPKRNIIVGGIIAGFGSLTTYLAPTVVAALIRASQRTPRPSTTTGYPPSGAATAG